MLEFSKQRDVRILEHHNDETRERVGFLVHELRNSVSTATLAVNALRFGNMSVAGATGDVLQRSLDSLTVLINRAVSEVRVGLESDRRTFPVAAFIADAERAGRLHANGVGCPFSVARVDPELHIHGNRSALLGAVANLVQNAFKFTHSHTEVSLKAFESDGQVLIEVHDHCGGLPKGGAEKMFTPFTQRSEDRRGLGLGLAIARSSVEADFGKLTVHDVPGTGCVFTVSLPARAPPVAAQQVDSQPAGRRLGKKAMNEETHESFTREDGETCQVLVVETDVVGQSQPDVEFFIDEPRELLIPDKLDQSWWFASDSGLRYQR